MVCGKDLKAKSREFLTEHFKNSGEHYFNIVRGLHHSAVKPNRIPKSVAAEHTFQKNLTSEIYMMERLESIAEELQNRLERSKVAGKTITFQFFLF